jgi:hypothetical protein
MIHTSKNTALTTGVDLQAKHHFQLYLVRSNPMYENLPRVFITKEKNEKIIWSYELDEIQEVLFDNEFLLEEAEHLGTIKDIEKEELVANIFNPDKNELVNFQLTPKLFWIFETLMNDHVIAKIGSVVYLARPKKFGRTPEIEEAEKEEIKRKRENLEYKQKTARKNYDDLYLPEDEVEEYVLKNRKNNRSINNSKNK